jgi:hypothetical protein
MIKPKTSTFSINVVGVTTGEKWTGDFTAKSYLSYRDIMAMDRYRRDLIGDKPENASIRAVNQSEVLSQIFARLTKAPAWWGEHSQGLDCVDDNLIEEIFLAAVKVETDEREAIKKKGEAAQASLRETLKAEDAPKA